MGMIEAQPTILQPTQAASPPDLAAWLDLLLASGFSPGMDLRAHLANATFDSILAAFDRAQPHLTPPSEIALYHHWLEANPGSPFLWAGWFNLGTLFSQAGDTGNAAIAYGNALALRPDMHVIAINLGLLQEATGQADAALATWQRATQPDATRIALEIQQGRLLEKLGRFDEAERMLGRVLHTDPSQPDVLHHWVHLRQKTCLWPITPPGIAGLPPEAQARGSGPFGIMALTDDIELQCENAAHWVARKTEPAPRHLAPAMPYAHPRIRLGYMSSDFCSHAMSYLITELFEHHDRQHFEIYGYCASQEDGSPLRQRVLAAFDHIRFIRDLSDEQAAQCIRDDEIDILIDLNGITDGSRLQVLRWRPAPIQATYLGFVGPVPLPELDYLLCDTITIPPEHEAAYRPRPLPIARLYQANDSKRTIGHALTRAEAGLPQNAFVLCCFSKHYKITEQVFAAWMEILHHAPHAVLWLAQDNPYSQANLIAAARRAGIHAGRLIFSERADPDLYMSRLGLADLFLDTFPYNAGTVASDALRMGLPLVTLCGRAFASRMATSLLHAIGATEGITTSLKQYAATATRLANDRAAFVRYKAHFTRRAWRENIGNIEAFTREFEATLRGLLRPPEDALQAATRHHLAGDLAAAEPLYQAILAAPEAPALAAFSYGLLCTAQNRLAEAEVAYRRAIATQPDYADAYINLGTLILAQNQPREALACYDTAVALRPQNAMAHGNRGKALQDLGQLDAAIAAYETALALQPDSPDILANFGAALLDRQDWAAAAAATRRAIALNPRNPMAFANLATALLNLGAFDDAVAACRAAAALRPENAAILGSIGGALLELGQPAEALPLCLAAIARDPLLPSAQFNLSHALKSLNRLPEAAIAARNAILLRPEEAQYHFHLGHLLLLQGELETGWAEYEWRWRLPDFAWAHTLLGPAPPPRWDGGDLAGKTILVITEQGLGDIIQFARYLPMLAARAARVIVAASPATRALLATIPDILVISNRDRPLPECDVYCPLMSLPLAFRTSLETIPANTPYLHPSTADISNWAARIPQNGRPRIGLVWAGNPITRRDRFRSPGLASVAPLLALPGIDIIVLQMGPGRAELAGQPLPAHVLDLGPDITDLTDTAAIMKNLDLVISSCTSPLHLAGALGVPAWAMIPFAPHFPWLLERTDSLWYQATRLYRQDAPGQDWTRTIARIATDLTVLANPPPPQKTLIFCTAFAREPTDWATRYARWRDAIRQSGLPASQILLIDDGSATLPDWPDLHIATQTDHPTPDATPAPGGTLLYHFQTHLGRIDVSQFPGWHRSYTFAARYAEAHGFTQIIHIESDAFLISERARKYLASITDGWVAFYCEKYAFPEIAINVAAGEGLQKFIAWARASTPAQPGEFPEFQLPFTHVERNFTGDRYGETRNDIPHDADYAAQAQIGREIEYYWWMRTEIK